MVKLSKKATPETKNWYRDRYQYVLVQRKILATLTVCSLAATMVCVVVIAQLTPLKEVVPFVIQVEDKTGITQVVDPAAARVLTTNEAVTNYFLVTYVRAREGYDSTDLKYNYNVVRLMSEPVKVYPAFMKDVDANTPESPVARLGSKGTRTVKIKSIAYLKPQLAQVRVMIEEGGESVASVKLHRIILVGFEYTKMEISAEERYINPLGFRITSYRMDEDSALP